MKRSIIALTIILMMTLTGCNRSSHDDYSRIYESYNKIENYTADIEVTVISKGEKSTYKAKQYYSAPDSYRLDYTSEGMEKTSSVLKGDVLKFKDPDGKVTKFSGYVPSEKYYIFITDFMERYCKSETAENTLGQGETILYLPEESDDPSRAAMKLWIDSETGAPKKLVTYNDKGDETVIVTYSNFKMNQKLDKKIFDI